MEWGLNTAAEEAAKTAANTAAEEAANTAAMFAAEEAACIAANMAADALNEHLLMVHDAPIGHIFVPDPFPEIG